MRKVLALALLVVAATFLTLAAVAWASHDHPGVNPSAPNADTHTLVDGNPKCSDNTISLKIDSAPSNGTFFGFIQISGFDGTSFDWTLLPGSGWDMAAVIVKGGPNGNLYTYDFTGAGADNSDINLVPPVNPNNGKFYGFSHVDFCVDPKGGGDN